MTVKHKETLQKMLKQFVKFHNDERAEALGAIMCDNIVFSRAIVRLFNGDTEKASEYTNKLADELTAEAEARYREIDEWSL